MTVGCVLNGEVVVGLSLVGACAGNQEWRINAVEVDTTNKKTCEEKYVWLFIKEDLSQIESSAVILWGCTCLPGGCVPAQGVYLPGGVCIPACTEADISL